MNVKNDFVSQDSIHCVEHPNSTIITDPINADEICKKCGIVVNEDRVDLEYDAKQESSENTQQSEVDPTQDNQGLGTVMPASLTSTEASNHGITKENREWINRLHNPKTSHNFKATSEYKEIKRNNVFRVIKDICKTRKIPPWINKSACNYYTKIIEKNNLQKFKNDKRLAAGCVYRACKNSDKVSINMDELAKIIGDKNKKIIIDYNYIYRNMHKKNLTNKNFGNNRKKNIALKIMRWELEIPEKLKRKSLEWLEKPKFELIMSGSEDTSIAAGIIYIICKKNDLKITPKKIAKEFGVGENTVRNQAKKIAKLLEIILLDKRIKNYD
jgi:transcription initiation factor TFIIIB Brf1 subunit/transcription initiation factor TFIIB